jgi:hypothetical protein
MGCVLTDGKSHVVRANLQVNAQQLAQLANILGISPTDPMLFNGVSIHLYLSARPATGAPPPPGPASSPGAPPTPPSGGVPPSSPGGGAPPSPTGGGRPQRK